MLTLSYKEMLLLIRSLKNSCWAENSTELKFPLGYDGVIESTSLWLQFVFTEVEPAFT